MGAAGLPPFSIGYVNVIGLLLLVPAGVWAAPYGVRLAHGISRRRLEAAFAAVLGLVSLRFVIGVFS
jgi:uncharacterized membrane protein YfcA